MLAPFGQPSVCSKRPGGFWQRVSAKPGQSLIMAPSRYLPQIAPLTWRKDGLWVLHSRQSGIRHNSTDHASAGMRTRVAKSFSNQGHAVFLVLSSLKSSSITPPTRKKIFKLPSSPAFAKLVILVLFYSP